MNDNATVLRRLSMAVCASRLDASLSADEFTERLEQLIECASAEGFRRGLAQAEAEGKPKDPTPAARFGYGPNSVDPADRQAVDRMSSTAPAAEALPSKRRRLSYDDRVRMRERYDATMKGPPARQRAPIGLLEQMAGEFGVSVSTVKETLYHRGT